MKLKVNPFTGMVALIAGDGMMNMDNGAIFGATPDQAGSLIAKKAASPLPDDRLPKIKGKWHVVDINTETGLAGEVEEDAADVAEADKKDSTNSEGNTEPKGNDSANGTDTAKKPTNGPK